MDPTTKVMEHPGSAKHENLATKPHRKIKVKNDISRILHLPGREQVITYSWDGSFRIWDLQRGAQIRKEWEDKDFGVETMALSPDGKTMANGSLDGAVKLWNIETGKVIKTWTAHTILGVVSVCWSPDGRRVVSGCQDGTFIIRDVENGETIVGPIKAENVDTVCYSPDGKIIATSGGPDGLKIWDADTGELLKTVKEGATSLAWTSDGKTLIAGGIKITKFNTTTWSQIAVIDLDENFANTISLSPNERVLASTSLDKTVRLWNVETNQSIGTPLHHEDDVISATFSADKKSLVTSCSDGHIYTWDVSAILRETGLLSDIPDVTPQPVPKMKGVRRIPQGFFDDALRDANSLLLFLAPQVT